VEGGFASYNGLVVEVTCLRDRTISERADVAADGSFGFRAIPEGDYLVRVTTPYDAELANTITTVGPYTLPFEIRMPESRLQKPVQGTVPIRQLNHPPSRQIKKLLESGHKLVQDRRYSDAAERFREAARDAPDCLQARADLALTLFRMGALDAAAEEYRAALSLDPRNSMLHSNLGGVLAASKHFDEAAKESTVALKLDPRNARAHFVLGGLILQQQGPLPQAVSHLVAAGESVPSARKAVEKICAANRVKGCP
jgi:tetratricopeptide (TPR) repeat protein